jgi:hypothetical protein
MVHEILSGSSILQLSGPANDGSEDQIDEKCVEESDVVVSHRSNEIQDINIVHFL